MAHLVAVVSDDDHLPLFVSLLVTDESNPAVAVEVADRALKSGTGTDSGGFAGSAARCCVEIIRWLSISSTPCVERECQRSWQEASSSKGWSLAL